MGAKFWMGMALAACAGLALAADPRVELGMIVTGTIEVDPAGNVLRYSLDQPGKLPAAVTETTARAVAKWKFEPGPGVHGPGAVHRMTLRFVAKPLGTDQYGVRIADASFFACAQGEFVTGVKLQPPHYTLPLGQQPITGTVYVLVKVGRDGRVMDAVAEQVNLRAVGSEAQLDLWRGTFARASLDTAVKWTFAPPKRGPHAGEAHWNARVPVEFLVKAEPSLQYGEWEIYIPGPRNEVPWLRDSRGSDALSADGVYPTTAELKLLTPLADA